MKKGPSRAAGLAFLAFLVLIAAGPGALAFEAVDTVPWPSRGAFPAYPRDAVRPTDLWVQGGMQHDSNVVRSETDERSETITRVGAGFRHDQRLAGRQHVVVDARGDYYHFNRIESLNHFAYTVLGNWLWEVGNDLSGSVILGRDRRQADIAETRSTIRDPVTITRIVATAGYLVTPSVRVRGGLAGARAERRLAAEAETRATSVTAAAEYVSPLRNTLGVEYRNTRGDAPVPEFVVPLGTFVDNDFDEREVAFVAAYVPVPQLRSAIRIGRTERQYTQIAGRDFDGTTGRILVEWLPGNKTILGFEAYKVPQSVIDIAAGHVVAKGVAFSPRWAANNKLVLSARFSRDRRTFQGDPAVSAGAPLRDEVSTLVRFAVGWEFARHWEAAFAIDRGERESNVALRDYQYTAYMANVAWRW